MRRFTLRFPDGDFEREFQEEYFRRSVRPVRLVLGIGTLLYLGFLPGDYLFLPRDSFRTVTAIRLVTSLLLLAILAFTFAPSFRRWWQLAMASAITSVALSVGFMAAASPPNSHMARVLPAAFLLYVMVTFTVGRLRLPHALFTGVVLLAIYNATMATTGGEPGPTVLVNNLMIVCGIVLGATGAYLLEHYIRSSYRNARLLDSKRAELENTNRLLEKRNADLARSREQVMRSARRTELVFLALTDALPGTILDDKYQIEEKIGSGSFGTVYGGTHLQLGTRVAVKVLRPYQGQDEIGVLERLRQEGISAWRLRHPNVVAVLDFSVAAETVAYLVMELLVGRSLAQEVQPDAPLPVARVAQVIEPVCRALAEAHAHGIIHRDIKPSNVFLHQSASGEVVKVIDFGIAKVLDDGLVPGSDRRTQTGMLLGTPAYFAPERLEGAAYGGEVDMYSVGVMLYELLAGRFPFPTRPDWTTALMPLAHRPVPLRSLAAHVPAELDDAIERAMSLDPAARPTAAEFADLLAAVRTESYGMNRRATQPSPVSLQPQ
jgi:hypothetical protein